MNSMQYFKMRLLDKLPEDSLCVGSSDGKVTYRTEKGEYFIEMAFAGGEKTRYLEIHGECIPCKMEQMARRL